MKQESPRPEGDWTRSAGRAIIAVRLAMIFLLAPSSIVAQDLETGFLDRTITLDGLTLPYQLYVPRDYDPAERWPVILFLHGAGERGTDGLLQTEVGLGSAIRRFPERYPAIVVFPQIDTGSAWHGRTTAAALAALDRTLAAYSTDPDRVYLTGLSMGGNGAWRIAYERPDRFAAVVVVCGFVLGGARFPDVVPAAGTSAYDSVAQRVKGLPIRLFHGDEDRAVPVTESRRMHAALRALGADVAYTELEGVGHNAWDPAYGSPELAAWLFAQRKR